ncbi:hypothetical protein SeMB42_g01278 [Synchytrium endobioticum]|uniref:Soluble NSF attachment protein n=1 Tax=Synchytrium endobioticum TaxID=286115 RepID=A0A507CPD2_9FUNG|nr:hypothetical protein SeLEV6574_g06305 [Synchytrium endobioticum]TPX52656.1 hypothetical protein SeMB42_g01278 [Synchytrium endobioticum]
MADKEAYSLLAQAHKKAKAGPGGLFAMFAGSSQEESADLYARAGNAFKLAKKWKEAGDAYMLQASTLMKMNEPDEASSAFMNAAKAYKKEFPSEAVSAFQQSTAALVSKGRFHAAAGNEKSIAEIYETELADQQKAMESYDRAADYYLGEDQPQAANQCLLKVANLAAELGNYSKATEKYEQVAEQSANNAMTRFSLRTYFLNAGLCHLASGDYVKTGMALEKYLHMDVSFSDTREYLLLKTLLDCVEQQDAEEFTNAVADFDKLTRLDALKTKLLLKVKKAIGESESIT